MTAQHSALLNQLTEWSKLDTSNSDKKHDKKSVLDVDKLMRISTAKRGVAQQLPASTLQPV